MNFGFITGDVTKILSEIGHDVILRRVTKTLDSFGNTTAISTSDSTIKAWIHPVTFADAELLNAGWVVGQEAVGVFDTTDINVHDLIIDGSTTYEVVDILSRTNVAGSQLFSRCRLRRI